MAFGDCASVFTTETPPPLLQVDVYTLDGFACSVVVNATLTLWELKSLLKRRMQIPKRDMTLTFGTNVLSVPNERLGSALGVMAGTVDVNLIRAPAVCMYCGALGEKRCGGCFTYYCGRSCQRHDWSRHRRLDQCSAARPEAPVLPQVDDFGVMLDG